MCASTIRMDITPMPTLWSRYAPWLKTDSGNTRRKRNICASDGEEKGFTGAEFKQAQKEGWEKQYQYKVGRKKEYMAPSAAEAAGYERASKTPKSTRFGRQNPIAARWNSDEQLVLWRSAWADVTNRYLERVGAEARIDHRSHADRGILEQPTIHEGVTARAMEQQGFIADRKTDDDGMKEVKQWVASMEGSLQRLEQTEAKYQAKLDAALAQFRELAGEAESMDKTELHDQRQLLRKPYNKDAQEKIQQAHGKQYNALTMLEAEQDVDHLLREDERKQEPPVQKRPVRHQPEPQKKPPKRDYER